MCKTFSECTKTIEKCVTQTSTSKSAKRYQSVKTSYSTRKGLLSTTPCFEIPHGPSNRIWYSEKGERLFEETNPNIAGQRLKQLVSAAERKKENNNNCVYTGLVCRNVGPMQITNLITTASHQK